MQLSGRGDNANANVQQGANSYTQGYGQSQNALGDARASGLLGVTGAIQGGLSALAGAFGKAPGMGGSGGFPTGTRYDTPGIYDISNAYSPRVTF
jgi:hypothetical protein